MNPPPAVGMQVEGRSNAYTYLITKVSAVDDLYIISFELLSGSKDKYPDCVISLHDWQNSFTILKSEPTTKPKTDGMHCVKCNDFYFMAEPNESSKPGEQADQMRCWRCRTYKY